MTLVSSEINRPPSSATRVRINCCSSSFSKSKDLRLIIVAVASSALKSIWNESCDPEETVTLTTSPWEPSVEISSGGGL